MKDVVFVVHPVTPEQKAKFRKAGAKVVDALFAPAGAEVYDADGKKLSKSKAAEAKGNDAKGGDANA